MAEYIDKELAMQSFENAMPDGDIFDAIDKLPTVAVVMDERNGGKAIDLSKDEAFSLAEFIDMQLLDYIRIDTDIDSLQWLRNIVHAYEKLCDYSGYNGVTE